MGIDEKEYRRMIVDIGRRMYQAGFVAANDGNISIKISDDVILTTPTGVSKGYMTEDMLVLVDMNGNVIEGNNKPSTELKMHLAVYRENRDVRSVCHAHPPVSTAFGVAGIDMNKPIIAETLLTLKEVPIIGYEELGSDKLAESIVPYCNKNVAVILAHHGAVTWGKDIFEAYYRMESMEHYGKIYIYSKILGNQNILDSDAVEVLKKIGEERSK